MNKFILLMTSVVAFSCATDHDVVPANRYTFSQPENFPPAIYTFQNNPVTQAGFELGRMLFYDPVMSLDSTIACANCHQQARAFSDPVHRFSKGVSDVSGFRNAPAIQNVAFQDHFFWDGGVSHLDFVPINALTSELEMHETLHGVIAKLQRSTFYPEKFGKSFGDNTVTSQRILFALSQFMALMVSDNSRYDRYVAGDAGALSHDEVDGLQLFGQKCATCHATELFTDGSFRNNGLDNTFERDSGRQRVTEFGADRGKFKVPSLRNAGLTAPYMHDGRFITLEAVLDHYAHHVVDSETLDPLLESTGGTGIVMTDDEQKKIILFIHSLTDREYTNDKRFSNPFTAN